jgi:hypothetical protein
MEHADGQTDEQDFITVRSFYELCVENLEQWSGQN